MSSRGTASKLFICMGLMHLTLYSYIPYKYALEKFVNVGSISKVRLAQSALAFRGEACDVATVDFAHLGDVL